jgi:hypothetical protein
MLMEGPAGVCSSADKCASFLIQLHVCNCSSSRAKGNVRVETHSEAPAAPGPISFLLRNGTETGGDGRKRTYEVGCFPPIFVQYESALSIFIYVVDQSIMTIMLLMAVVFWAALLFFMKHRFPDFYFVQLHVVSKEPKKYHGCSLWQAQATVQMCVLSPHESVFSFPEQR